MSSTSSEFGMLTKKILELILELKLMLLKVLRHDGTYGVKRETHEIAIKIARLLPKHLKKLILIASQAIAHLQPIILKIPWEIL